MGLLNAHLDDGAFADIWADRLAAGGEPHDRSAETHLRACAECRSRYAAFCGWLEAMRADAIAEADEVFAPERLAAQQAQIVRRLEALEHPGKVIAFPRFARPISAQPNGRRRWVAAAAAAGLIAGVGLGQVLEFGGARRAQPAAAPAQQMARGTMPVPESGRMVVQPVSQIGDELFLDDQATPSQVRVPESLQYLNAITPSARDYDPR